MARNSRPDAHLAMLTSYADTTLRELENLTELQLLLGDPRNRVEVPHVATEDDPVPMPVCRRYQI